MKQSWIFSLKVLPPYKMHFYQQKLPLNNKLKAFGHIASPMYKKHF